MKIKDPLDEQIVLDFSLYWPAVRNKEMTIKQILYVTHRYGKGWEEIKKLPKHIQQKIKKARKQDV